MRSRTQLLRQLHVSETYRSTLSEPRSKDVYNNKKTSVKRSNETSVWKLNDTIDVCNSLIRNALRVNSELEDQHANPVHN